MKLLLALILAHSPVTSKYIKALQPGIPDSRASVLVQIINSAGERYAVDPIILAAIIRQESNFRSGLKQCNVVHRYGRDETTCDLGIAQVNEFWVEHWQLDAERLRNDDRYNVMVAARILRFLQRSYSEDEAMWFGRYHSGTPSKRAAYEDKLQPMLELARNP